MKLKVITWNIAGLPNYFNLHGNPELRIEKIINKLKSQNADIICLQEVFTASLIKSIKSAFRDEYFTRSSTIRRNYKWLGSGLVTLFRKSKFSIRNLKFYHFKYTSGEDKMANKGLQIFSVYSYQLKKMIIVINTHLNNPDAILSRYKNSLKVTKNQVLVVKQLLDNYKDKYTILGGDLNIPKLKFKCCVRNKIDYICVNNFNIQKNSNKIFKSKLSDHSLVSCIVLK